MRENFACNTPAKRAHQQRLAQTGHTLEQHVPTSDQTQQHAVDDLALANDHFGDLASKPLEILPEAVQLVPKLRADVAHA